MKTLSLFAAILFSIFSINTATAQSGKKETIKVWGNCGMCKTTIEKAAKKGGAKTANWNEDSKELLVTYAVNKTSSVKIQQAIAKSGYDTQDFTAIQTAYNNLHGCCKYDRKSDDAAKTKCCGSEKCGTVADCCTGMECCKDKSCCNKKGEIAMKCCSAEKCGTVADCCAGMECCKDKSYCNKKDEMAMKCCSAEKCGKDAAACKAMKDCKDKACCKS